MAKEYEANQNQELDLKIKEINEKYQKLMKPVTVTKLGKAFKGAARSYEVSITNHKDPLLQPHGSNKAIESRLKELLVEMKGIYATMKILFKKPQDDNTLYKVAYFNDKPQIIIGQWLSEHAQFEISPERKQFQQILTFYANDKKDKT